MNGCSEVDCSNDWDSDGFFAAMTRLARCDAGRRCGCKGGIGGGEAESRKAVHDVLQ